MPRSCPATLCRIASAVADPPPADRDLLRAFVTSRSEPAVAELVRRHGPMVFATCRRVLGHAHDAEDAFQATFLVLTRKARLDPRRERRRVAVRGRRADGSGGATHARPSAKARGEHGERGA